MLRKREFQVTVSHISLNSKKEILQQEDVTMIVSTRTKLGALRYLKKIFGTEYIKDNKHIIVLYSKPEVIKQCTSI